MIRNLQSDFLRHQWADREGTDLLEERFRVQFGANLEILQQGVNIDQILRLDN